jgi:hypothetical protein
MHEKKKFKEAVFHFDEMKKNASNPTAFEFCLSAFLSASRSVLQYARAELEKNSERLKWYDSYFSKHPILKFFRDKRNTNIHRTPVTPLTGLNYKGKISFTLYGYANDNAQKVNTPHNNAFSEQKPTNSNIDAKFMGYTYKFDDWTGSEDVILLCQQYIKELSDFILEAQRKGYITS